MTEPERQRSDLIFLLQFHPSCKYPFDYIIHEMFPDIPMTSWCEARGIESYLLETPIRAYGEIKRELVFQYAGEREPIFPE